MPYGVAAAHLGRGADPARGRRGAPGAHDGAAGGIEMREPLGVPAAAACVCELPGAARRGGLRLAGHVPALAAPRRGLCGRRGVGLQLCCVRIVWAVHGTAQQGALSDW